MTPQAPSNSPKGEGSHPDGFSLPLGGAGGGLAPKLLFHLSTGKARRK